MIAMRLCQASGCLMTVLYILVVNRRMSRDQRSKDNWALLYACEMAHKTGSHVVVTFNLVRL